MEWIQNSRNYKYLENICESLEPRDEEELVFKLRLKWLLEMAVEQERALLNIEKAQNSDIDHIPSLKPKLRLLKGGLIK